MVRKLVYVDRHWKPRNENARDALETVINAIQSVSQPQRHTACDVFSYSNASPSGSQKAVDVICDGHKIELTIIDSNELHAYEIEESVDHS